MQVTLMSLLVTLNKHFPLVPLISSSPDSVLNNLRLIFSCTDLLFFKKENALKTFIKFFRHH